MRNYKQTAEDKIKRDDRVRYYVIKLKNIVSKNELFELIEKKGITSKSTAGRVAKSVFDWGKGEIELFLATYNPTKSDSKAIEKILGLNASKVSSKVIEEPKNDNERFEEELKDGEIINHDGGKYKFVYTGICNPEQCNKCALNCGSKYCICDNKIPINDVNGYFVEVVEETDIINELSAKNQELQKELQKYKNDLNIVLDDRRKLECLLLDSANAIAEVTKEKDDKAGEIKSLKFDSLRKDNYIGNLVGSLKTMETKYENLLEVLETKNLNIELNPKYDSLYKVLLSAYNQASNGKGKERHQLNNEEYFENQKICEIARRLSVDYNLGQAVKKIYESKRLTDGRDIAELYGAINYIAAAIIVKQEE